MDLDGVEFKSLPSGLHRLQEDLVYFVHGSYAGLSAFLNVETSEEERGALMVCAGILAPLSYGRLGRSWRHAEGLKALARYVVPCTLWFSRLVVDWSTAIQTVHGRADDGQGV